MGHSRIATGLDIVSSQQYGALIRKAGVLQGNIFTALGYGIFVDECLGAQHSARIVEPGQTVAILRRTLKRIDLVKAVLPTGQLNY